MNRKLFGNNIFRLIALLALLVGTVSACSNEKIAGDPKKVLKEYIEAVQKGDFDTIYALNHVTARQNKWLKKSETGDVKMQEDQNYQRHKAIYNAAIMEPAQGVLWAEKFFFPRSSKVEIGKPRDPESFEKETLGDAYEKGVVAVLSVSVSYPVPEEAPLYNGIKMSHGDYNCMLRKIRYDNSVMIYSYDEKWFFAGCLLNSTTVR